MRKDSNEDKLNRLIEFRPIPERELQNLPRAIRIAKADERLALRRRYEENMKNKEILEKETRHQEWRRREENRARNDWRQEWLKNRSCLTCGDLTHHANQCESVEAVPVW